MPRSSKAPPPPPEPDINELIQNDVAKIKRLLGLDVNRLALGSEVEGIVTDAVFGSDDYTITGVNVIELVNVSTSIGPAQGSSGFPAQVVGLTVTPQAGSDTQLNLAWTVTSLPAEFNNYNVYRGPTGFPVGPAFEISEPTTNSYQNTGLIPGTTYYYRVSITNNAGLEGPASSQVNGTTTGTAPVNPTVWYKFDNSLLDSSGNGNNATGSTIPLGYVTPGQFGTHAILCNTSGTLPNTFIRPFDTAHSPQMNTTVGFSVSLWIYPTDISALDERRVIVEQRVDANNQWTLQMRSDGTLMFFVRKAGIDYKRQKGGFVTGSWQHIGATFNAATNAIEVYRDAVAGIASTQTPEYATDSSQTMTFSFRWNESLNHYYQGRYDEFQLFNGTVLTPTQITNLKNTNVA
jgi:hypothetical protein